MTDLDTWTLTILEQETGLVRVKDDVSLADEELDDVFQAIEDEFDVFVTAVERQGVQTVGDLLRLVREKVGA